MKLGRFFAEASACVSAAGGGMVALLLAEPWINRVARPLSVLVAHPKTSAPRLETLCDFAVTVVAALAGASLGVLVAWLGRKLPRGKARVDAWAAPLLMLVLVVASGALHRTWLVYAAPVMVLAVAPLFATGSVPAVASASRDGRAAVLCLAAEAACFGVGVWFPFAETGPALLLPAMALPAALAAGGASRLASADLRWRLVFAGAPALALPMVGLLRNPTLLPALACAALAAGVAWALSRRREVAAMAAGWARRNVPTLAVPAVLLVLVVPWHFRELGMADYRGHEGQHLGWINSITFGKLMMADAGLTYGPAREYILALLAWIQGGLTLEHVRVAHVLVNVAGFVLTYAAMRRVAAGQGYLLFIGALLLVTHSTMVSWVVYTTTYSFGWADASRAALATLSVVVVLARRKDDARMSRRSLLGGGALVAFAMLYSHDFGLPAMLATLAGIGSEVLCRRGPPWKARARAALRSAGVYGLGFVLVAVPVLAVYAVKGRLGAFFQGYLWTIQVSSSSAPFQGKAWFVDRGTFTSYAALTDAASEQSVGAVGARTLDYVLGPAFPLLGLAHVVVAILRRRFVQRTALVAGLSLMGAMTLHHAFLAADPWHIDNASTPGLVLLVALAAGARRLHLRLRGRHVLPVGALCAAFVPVAWLAIGAAKPLNTRLASIASGEERPSVGPAYRYDGVPRAGDVKLAKEQLAIPRFVREHSQPSDPVFCTTWLLGGGTEAFLSQRRNPTSFDKPDEVASGLLQRRALAELQADPPLFVVGHHFDELGGDVAAYIKKGWHDSGFPDDPRILERNR
jgi:hypothetical protein